MKTFSFSLLGICLFSSQFFMAATTFADDGVSKSEARYARRQFERLSLDQMKQSLTEESKSLRIHLGMSASPKLLNDYDRRSQKTMTQIWRVQSKDEMLRKLDRFHREMQSNLIKTEDRPLPAKVLRGVTSPFRFLFYLWYASVTPC